MYLCTRQGASVKYLFIGYLWWPTFSSFFKGHKNQSGCVFKFCSRCNTALWMCWRTACPTPSFGPDGCHSFIGGQSPSNPLLWHMPSVSPQLRGGNKSVSPSVNQRRAIFREFSPTQNSDCKWEIDLWTMFSQDVEWQIFINGFEPYVTKLGAIGKDRRVKTDLDKEDR